MSRRGYKYRRLWVFLALPGRYREARRRTRGVTGPSWQGWRWVRPRSAVSICELVAIGWSRDPRYDSVKMSRGVIGIGAKIWSSIHQLTGREDS